MSVTFRTTVELAGKTATGIRIPADAVESLGSGKRPPVLVTIKGYAYRNTVAVYGSAYFVGVSAEHRAGARAAAGDEVEVTLELDTAHRLSTTRGLCSRTRRRCEGERVLRRTVGQQQKLVCGQQTLDTRQRQIEKYVGMLRDGRAR